MNSESTLAITKTAYKHKSSSDFCKINYLLAVCLVYTLFESIMRIVLSIYKTTPSLRYPKKEF